MAEEKTAGDSSIVLGARPRGATARPPHVVLVVVVVVVVEVAVGAAAAVVT